MAKSILKFFTLLILVIISILILLLRPIDRSTIDEDPGLPPLALIENSEFESDSLSNSFQAGWARVSMIPDFPTPLAGYAPRERYESVHDTLFINCLILKNAKQTIALLSFDLLIVPPLLKELIEQDIQNKDLPIQFAYYTASHTHNGIGGWDNSIGGQLMTGTFNEKILVHLHEQTKVVIDLALTNIQPASVSYFETRTENMVRNRVDEGSKVDDLLKGIEIINAYGQKAILTTFSAHATNIQSKSRELSNDYPGMLNDVLESKGYDFSMFMAGTVGSHSTKGIGKGFEEINKYSIDLANQLDNEINRFAIENPSRISFDNILLPIHDSQLRVTDNLRLGDEAFNKVFSPLDANIKFMEVGNVIFLGMPCDFSGEIAVEDELYEYAASKGKHLIITSFNGEYIGYITEDHHYEHSHHSEVMNMNWVGPHYGEYFSKIIKKIIDKS